MRHGKGYYRLLALDHGHNSRVAAATAIAYYQLVNARTNTIRCCGVPYISGVTVIGEIGSKVNRKAHAHTVSLVWTKAWLLAVSYRCYHCIHTTAGIGNYKRISACSNLLRCRGVPNIAGVRSVIWIQGPKVEGIAYTNTIRDIRTEVRVLTFCNYTHRCIGTACTGCYYQGISTGACSSRVRSRPVVACISISIVSS